MSCALRQELFIASITCLGARSWLMNSSQIKEGKNGLIFAITDVSLMSALVSMAAANKYSEFFARGSNSSRQSFKVNVSFCEILNVRFKQASGFCAGNNTLMYPALLQNPIKNT